MGIIRVPKKTRGSIQRLELREKFLAELALEPVDLLPDDAGRAGNFLRGL